MHHRPGILADLWGMDHYPDKGESRFRRPAIPGNGVKADQDTATRQRKISIGQ